MKLRTALLALAAMATPTAGGAEPQVAATHDAVAYELTLTPDFAASSPIRIAAPGVIYRTRS